MYVHASGKMIHVLPRYMDLYQGKRYSCIQDIWTCIRSKDIAAPKLYGRVSGQSIQLCSRYMVIYQGKRYSCPKMYVPKSRKSNGRQLFKRVPTCLYRRVAIPIKREAKPNTSYDGSSLFNMRAYPIGESRSLPSTREE
jgi:hypothetical protein